MILRFVGGLALRFMIYNKQIGGLVSINGVILSPLLGGVGVGEVFSRIIRVPQDGSNSGM
jgi:hypothetical protein